MKAPPSTGLTDEQIDEANTCFSYAAFDRLIRNSTSGDTETDRAIVKRYANTQHKRKPQAVFDGQVLN